MRVQEIIRLLKEDGWFLYETKGSHYQFKHKDKPGKVTVPRHSKDLPIGTLKSIIKQANIKLK